MHCNIVFCCAAFFFSLFSMWTETCEYQLQSFYSFLLETAATCVAVFIFHFSFCAFCFSLFAFISLVCAFFPPSLFLCAHTRMLFSPLAGNREKNSYLEISISVVISENPPYVMFANVLPAEDHVILCSKLHSLFTIRWKRIWNEMRWKQ